MGERRLVTLLKELPSLIGFWFSINISPLRGFSDRLLRGAITTNDFPVVSADSDHRLLSGNPSGCAEGESTYQCPRKGLVLGLTPIAAPQLGGLV